MASLGNEKEAKASPAECEEDVAAKLEATPSASKALKIKRWEVQEGPFEGFNSPPGRF